MPYLKSKLKNRVKSIRKAMGLTQQDLAERSKISLRHIQDIEAGKIDVRLSMLSRIAKCFRLEPFQLICEVGTENAVPALSKSQAMKGKKLGNLETSGLLVTSYCPLDEFPVALLIMDTNGLVKYCNSAFSQIQGYTREEVTAKMHVWEFFSGQKEQEDLKLYLKYVVAECPEPKPYLAENLCKDGRHLNVRIDWHYIVGPKRRLEGFFSYINSEPVVP